MPSASSDTFRISEVPNGAVLQWGEYEAWFSRAQARLTVRRRGGVILQGWAAGDLGGRLGHGDSAPVIGELTRQRALAEVLELEYATSQPGLVVLVQVRGVTDGLRVTVRVLHPELLLPGGFAWEMNPSGYWYGGGFAGWRERQVWPLNRAQLNKPRFLAASLSQASPVWYTTSGVVVWVRTPLDFSYAVNRGASDRPDGYLTVSMVAASALTYDLLLCADYRAAVHRVWSEVGRPRRTPPAAAFRDPVYTTWVEYKTEVTQDKVLAFARQILASGLPAGIIEIDDRWEKQYGDLRFDPERFPDPVALVCALHELGFRVTLWVHPFVAPEAAAFREHRDLLLADTLGEPALTRWWNGTAALWDFSNPAAGVCFRAALDRLAADYGFDGFKFDGGDAHFVPRDAQPARPMLAAEYPDRYDAETAAHYEWHETRVGLYSQPLGVVQRLIDKQSVWSDANGLAALVPEAITTSMRGFFHLMPDMVGGNQYDGDQASGELMIRWAQASALMPLLQFSLGPWRFGPDVVEACREAIALHQEYAPRFVELARSARATGEPILAPLVYHHPDDPETFGITDQFLVGRDLLVAPVVEAGAVTRNLYLPAGRWRDAHSGQVINGGRWLHQHPAPLHVLPRFERLAPA